MAQITVSATELKVAISFLESVQALQRSFNIPLSKVRGATVDHNYIKAGLGLRSPGTGFPGVVAKGHFYKNGDRQLSLWHKGQDIIVIELQDSKWNRLILGCEDAKLLVDSINNLLKK